jgi:crotonobetainyl-CoA:carnitine CoA-transferase CaiB-like acyl-CoA transferase
VIDHPHTGKTRIVRSPARFGGARLPAARTSPAHGEHTEALLRELGLDGAAIAQLRAEGGIA